MSSHGSVRFHILRRRESDRISRQSLPHWLNVAEIASSGWFGLDCLSSRPSGRSCLDVIGHWRPVEVSEIPISGGQRLFPSGSCLCSNSQTNSFIHYPVFHFSGYIIKNLLVSVSLSFRSCNWRTGFLGWCNSSRGFWSRQFLCGNSVSRTKRSCRCNYMVDVALLKTVEEGGRQWA